MLIKVFKYLNIDFKSFLFKYIICSTALIIFKYLYKYLKIISIIGIITIIFNFIQIKLSLQLEMELNENFRNSFLKLISLKTNAFWNKYSIGDVKTILDKDILTINKFVITWFNQIIINILIFIGIIFWIFMVNIYIDFVLLTLSFVFVIFQQYYSKKLIVKNRIVQREAEGIINSFSDDILNNIESLQLQDYAKQSCKQFRNVNNDYFNKSLKLLISMRAMMSIGMAFSIISILIILLIGINFINNGMMSI